ncbi:MAG: hypothetical protein J7M26_03820 [Armatimonadetes bacterium]|nr:hypothetical protein [Armatimonadota bacterium]
MAQSLMSSDQVAGPAPTDYRRRGFTWRAALLALVLIPINAYWVTMMAVVRYEGHPTTVSLFFNTIFLLAVLTALNSLAARLWPRRVLHRNELLVIYSMLCIASALVGHDLVQVVTPQIICPYELATPENKWADLFFKYLPPFLFIDDPRIYRPAFEGGTTLYRWERIRAWSIPVLHWATFLFVLTVVMLGLNALLRRRWMDREKLTYPITHLPLEMTEPGGTLWRNKVMWIAFAIAGLIITVNNLHNFWPAVPVIKVRVVHYDQYMRTVFRGFPWGALAGTRISFYPFAIGLGMLLPLDLAFSSWFFYLFWRAQILVSAVFGLTKLPQFPYVPEQSAAAYIALAVFALYMGKDHLAMIWQTIRRSGPEADLSGQPDEPLSYTTAFWLVVGGLIFLVVYSLHMGMWLWVAITVFVIYFMISLTVTRVRAELGPPAHDLHHAGPDQILTNIFGTDGHVLVPHQLTLLRLYFWFNRAYRAHPMPIQLESYKIAQQTGIPMRAMTGALVLAAAFGALAAFWAQIHLYYTYGITAKMSFVARYFGWEPFNELAGWLRAERPPNVGKMFAYGVGFLFTLALMTLRVRFVWWPFHPVGYAISSSWSMNCLWLPIFIAWLAKWVLLRYAGFKAFQRAIPFALGLVLGEFIVGGGWLLAGILFHFNAYAFWV